MRLMCERAYCLTGFGCTGEVCTTSRGEIGQCKVPKRLAKYKDIGGSARNTILALVRRTHPLIIGNSLFNQESHEQPCIPRRVYGGFVILADLDPYYVRGYLQNQHKHGFTPETKFSSLFWFYKENRARGTKIRHLSLIGASSIAHVHIAKTMPQSSCKIKLC